MVKRRAVWWPFPFSPLCVSTTFLFARLSPCLCGVRLLLHTTTCWSYLHPVTPSPGSVWGEVAIIFIDRIHQAIKRAWHFGGLVGKAYRGMKGGGGGRRWGTTVHKRGHGPTGPTPSIPPTSTPTPPNERGIFVFLSIARPPQHGVGVMTTTSW